MRNNEILAISIFSLVCSIVLSGIITTAIVETRIESVIEEIKIENEIKNCEEFKVGDIVSSVLEKAYGGGLEFIIAENGKIDDKGKCTYEVRGRLGSNFTFYNFELYKVN